MAFPLKNPRGIKRAQPDRRVAPAFGGVEGALSPVPTKRANSGLKGGALGAGNPEELAADEGFGTAEGATVAVLEDAADLAFILLPGRLRFLRFFGLPGSAASSSLVAST